MAGTSETFKNQSDISPFSWAGFLEAVDSLLFYSLSLSTSLSPIDLQLLAVACN
jgi:hypothetical protein